MAKKNRVLREAKIDTSHHWAIVSHLRPHQLAFRINEKCGLNLHRLKSISSVGKTKLPGFALFNDQQNDMQPDFYLIALKEDTHLLVKELKQFDYVLQVRLPDEDSLWDAALMIQNIRSIENVLGVFEINIETIKNIDVLFFDKELDKLELGVEVEKRVKIKHIIKKNERDN